MAKTPGEKGHRTEELLRAYFIRAGFFAVRGAPVTFGTEVATDVDIWLYERPTGSARRIQIVDAKSKSKPKAVERLFWVKGLAEAIDADGAYIATTDSRPALRQIATKLGVKLIDGDDLRRIRDSGRVEIPGRLTDEDLANQAKIVDTVRHSKEFQSGISDIKSSVVAGLGEMSTVRNLDNFANFAMLAIEAHADSDTAKIAGRLSLLSAALTSISLDYIGVQAAFRTRDEQREIFANAIRFGNVDRDAGLEKLRVATALLREFSPGGSGVAKTVEANFSKRLEAIPAEIVSDQAVRMMSDGSLFRAAKNLEHAAYLVEPPSYDRLDSSSKSLVGALLDYSSVDRERYAEAWVGPPSSSSTAEEHLDQGISEEIEAGPLFGRRSNPS